MNTIDLLKIISTKTSDSLTILFWLLVVLVYIAIRISILLRNTKKLDDNNDILFEAQLAMVRQLMDMRIRKPNIENKHNYNNPDQYKKNNNNNIDIDIRNACDNIPPVNVMGTAN